MRRAWAILSLILAGSPALAQNSFKAGAWTGSPGFNGQQFTHCVISRTYGDGMVLALQLTPRLELYVGARRSDWDMEASQYELTFEIDQGFKKTYSGTVAANNRNTVWFSLGNDAEFRRAFAAGQTMTWVGNRTRIPFNLAGADNAMRKLLACTALYGAE